MQFYKNKNPILHIRYNTVINIFIFVNVFWYTVSNNTVKMYNLQRASQAPENLANGST